MGNGSRPGVWGRWLKRETDRDGMSVARLARDADLNESTIWEYIKTSDGKRVTVRTLLRIASALGKDPVEAFRAAAELDEHQEADDEIRAVLDGGLPEDATKTIIANIHARRERNRERDMQDTQNTVQLARLIGDQSTP